MASAHASAPKTAHALMGIDFYDSAVNPRPLMTTPQLRLSAFKRSASSAGVDHFASNPLETIACVTSRVSH